MKKTWQALTAALGFIGLMLLVSFGQLVWAIIQTARATIQPHWTVLWLTVRPDTWGWATVQRHGREVSKLLNASYGSPAQLHWVEAWGLAVVVFALIVVALLLGLVRRLQRGSYFTVANAHTLTLIARLLLVGLIGSLLATLLIVAMQGVVAINFLTLLAAIGAVAGVFALRLWFNYGVALQQDQDAII